MYKILLCYAQTHKYIIYIERLRERQSITVQKKKREEKNLFDEEGENKLERKREMMVRRRQSFSKERR